MASLLSGGKKSVKIIFWIISPFLFFGILRFWWIIFGYMYGLILVALVGKNYLSVIAVISFLTALISAIVSFYFLYKLFKKNFIED